MQFSIQYINKYQKTIYYYYKKSFIIIRVFFNFIMAKFRHEFSLNKNRVVCHLFFHGLKLTTSYFRSKLIKLLPRSLLFSPEKCVVACGIFKTFLYFLDETWKFQLFVKIFSSIFYLYWNTAHILIFFRSCCTIFNFINLNNNFTWFIF